MNVCIRFDKLAISSFIVAGSMTYDEDIKIETSIDHNMTSDDGSGIYNPISSAVFNYLRLRNTLHEWYHYP